MKVRINQDCLVIYKNLNFSSDFDQFEETHYFTSSQKITRSYCSSLAMAIYAEPSFYPASIDECFGTHLPGITDPLYRDIYTKVIETFFLEMFGREVKQIVMGHEHGEKGKCYIQVCVSFNFTFQGIIKPGYFTIEDETKPLFDGVKFLYMNQKAKYTLALSSYWKKGGDYFFKNNEKEKGHNEESKKIEESFFNDTANEQFFCNTLTKNLKNNNYKSFEINLGNKENELEPHDKNIKKLNNNSNLSLFNNTSFKNEINEKIEHFSPNKSNLVPPPFSWIPNNEIFEKYPLIKKWFFQYASPQNLPKRKALLLYSDFPFLGKTEFSKRLINNPIYYVLMKNQFKVPDIKIAPKLGILDNLCNILDNHQTFQNLITGQRALIVEKEINYYWEYEIPWIITTRNWELVKFFYKSSEFNKFIIFVEIREYMGPNGTEPKELTEPEAWFTSSTWAFLKKEEELLRKKAQNKEVMEDKIMMDEERSIE